MVDLIIMLPSNKNRFHSNSNFSMSITLSRILQLAFIEIKQKHIITHCFTVNVCDNTSLCKCAQGFSQFYSVCLVTIPRVCCKVVSTWYGRGLPSQPCTVAGHPSRQSSTEARPILVSHLLLAVVLVYSSGRNSKHPHPYTF